MKYIPSGGRMGKEFLPPQADRNGGECMITERMFTMGRRYALAGYEEQGMIIRSFLGRMSHWAGSSGDEASMLFSCFIEGARSAEREGFQDPGSGLSAMGGCEDG